MCTCKICMWLCVHLCIWDCICVRCAEKQWDDKQRVCIILYIHITRNGSAIYYFVPPYFISGLQNMFDGTRTHDVRGISRVHFFLYFSTS